MRTVTVFIKINDDVISSGSPFEIIEPVWHRVSIYEGIGEYEAALSAFSLPQRLLFAIQWYRAEVCNGGHDQFFFNSAGIVWPDAVEGFEAIGLTKSATILREAVARLGTESRVRVERQMALELSEPDFDEFDRAFLEQETHGDIDERACAYARARPADFYFEGKVTRPDLDEELSME